MREKFSVLLCSLFLISAAVISTAQAATDPSGPTSPKEWTMLVYVNGKNSLDSYGPLNINQMEMVGSTDKINVVVEWGSEQTKKVERLLVKKDNNPKKVTSPVVQDMGNLDMGDWHSLADFITWGAKSYPAQHYMVVVWDHGSGFHAMHAMDTIFHPTDISWDDVSGNHISTKELGQAIAQGAAAIGHKIDIYGSDACLMAMAEVAGEMKDSVSYFVGSQDLEPGAGWPYDQILARMAKQSYNPHDAAALIAQEYTKSYMGGSNGHQEVTFAAYDMSKLEQFEAAIHQLGAEMAKLDADSRTKVLEAANSSASFTYSDYHDLIDFVSHAENLNLPMNRLAFTQVRSAMSQFLITNQVTSSWSGKANGISFWFPADKGSYDQYLDLYRSLNFQQATDWADALNTLYQ